MYFVHPKRTIFASEFRGLTCQKLLTCLKTLRTGRVLNLVVVVLCLLIQGKRILLNDVFWICLCTYTSMHACTSICIYKTMPGHVHMFTCICRPICMKKKKKKKYVYLT